MMQDPRSRLFGADGKTLGQDPLVAQAQAIQAELAMGRLALRVLAALLAETKGHKAEITNARWKRVRDKYPGAIVRFTRGEDRVTAWLSRPEDLAVADEEAAEAAEGGTNGESTG